LPKALHKFKFRINEDFKLNKNYPVMKEGNNKYNYIDTTETKDNTKSSNTEESKSDSDITDESDNTDESESSSSSSSYEREIDDKEYRYRKKKNKMKKKKYSQIFPKKNKLNNYAPDVPYSYNYLYNRH